MRSIVAAVGFSSRALVEALVSSGLAAVAVDYFADQDTRELADDVLASSAWLDAKHVPARRTAPASIAKWLGSVRHRAPTPQDFTIFLAGGTENWPELLAELHANFRVLGPDPAQCALIRHPDFWRECSEQAGLGFPETVLTARAGHWLRKSLGESGGHHVRRVELGEMTESDAEPLSQQLPPGGVPWVLQQEIYGRHLGATCILVPSHVGRCSLVGATESLTAGDWPGPSEFIYRGSVGPIELTTSQKDQVQLLCRHVQAQTGLVGWLQADFVEDEYGRLWLLELNPRWTSGMEILRLAGVQPLERHIFASGLPATHRLAAHCRQTLATSTPSNPRVAAKAVIYATHDLTLTERQLQYFHGLPRDSFADLPAPQLLGQTIQAGSPLLTVRTVLPAEKTGADIWDQTRQGLLSQLDQLRSTLPTS